MFFRANKQRTGLKNWRNRITRRQQLTLQLERLESRQLMAFNIADDSFSIATGTVLNVLGNDTTGTETQQVSAMNVNAEFSPATGGFQRNAIPDKPAPASGPQRSVFNGAVTISTAQVAQGNIDLYRDLDTDPTNDNHTVAGSVQRMHRNDGMVLAHLRSNSPLNTLNTNAATVSYNTTHSSGLTWIFTAAAPENAGAAAVNFGAAYFPYAAGWRGGSYNTSGAVTSGGAGLTVTNIGPGAFEVSVAGVTDSRTEGFLFSIDGKNEDNYARSIPVDDGKWLVRLRDNAGGLFSGENDQTNDSIALLYVPRSSQGLIGGVVRGAATEVNPMVQSYGDFSIQRQSDGIWKLEVPGHNSTTGVLVMESWDQESPIPRNTYFTYDADPNDADAILIR